MHAPVSASARRRGFGCAVGVAGLLAAAGCSADASGSGSGGGHGGGKATQKPSACSLLKPDDVRTAFGGVGDPFNSTRPDAIDGQRPWGCTWGNQASYASVAETDAERYRADIKAPGGDVIPQNIGEGDSFAVYPADDDEPMRFAFTVGSAYYRLTVVPARDGDYPRFQQSDIGTDLLRLLIPAMEGALT